MNSCYSVAGLDFCIECEHLRTSFFNNYAPFRIESNLGSPLLFKMVFRKLPPMRNLPFRIYRTERGEYHIYISDDRCDVVYRLTGSTKVYRLSTNRKWSYIEVDMGFEEINDYIVLNDFIMFSFIYSAAFHQTVLLHASCIMYGEYGVAFMGTSGVGKSTHSQLWINNVEGATLLNDDQPAVRFVNEKVCVFGTPWSGKTPCYRNKQVELKAIYTMEQALENEIRRISPLVFFQQLLSSCSMIREDELTFDKITITLSAIVKNVQAFHFKNKPDKTAVDLSYYTAFGNRNKTITCFKS